MSIEVTQNLPAGWRWVSLNELGNIVGGDAAPQDADVYKYGTIPFVRMKDVGRYHFTLNLKETDDKLRQDAVTQLGMRIFPPGTILMPRSGSVYTNHRARLAVYAAVVGHLAALLPADEIFDSVYVTYALRMVDMRQWMTKTTGLDSISLADLNRVQIPLPPLFEQKRIATILTEKMAAVKKAREAAEARLKAAKELPAAYLREVFESKASQKWPRKRLGDLATVIQNGIYKSAEHYGHGQPFVRMYNVPNGHWKLSLDTLAQVSLDEPEKQRFVLQKDDILVSRVNSFELVGKCAWVGLEAEGYAFENMLIRVRLGDQIDPKFIAQQFGTKQVRKQIEKVAKRAIGQASINSEDIRGIELMLPPTEEQRRLSKMIDEKSCVVANVSAGIESELRSINDLPAALLRQAFAGGF